MGLKCKHNAHIITKTVKAIMCARAFKKRQITIVGTHNHISFSIFIITNRLERYRFV